MALKGLQKQFNKANQYVNEKIGGAKGTELDEEYLSMEKKVDVMAKLIDDMTMKVQELLQPNPATRAMMSASKSLSKLSGQSGKQQLYPQPEAQLGDCMLKYGPEMGSDSTFGRALIDIGDSYKQLAEFKFALEDSVRQNFTEPFHHLQEKDLKEVNHHRKKVSSRRLDYDFKKKKQQKDGSISHEEVQLAEDKFVESKELAETAMHNLLENDVEQILQLSSFVEAELEFHRRSQDVLQSLLDSLKEKCKESSNRPRKEHVPRRVTSTRSTGSDSSSCDGKPPAYQSYETSQTDFSLAYPSKTYATNNNSSNGGSYGDNNEFLINLHDEPVYSVVNKKPAARGGSKPRVEALYDFEPENQGELGFREGDIIDLISHVDENWLEGTINGQTGLFPVSYVKILVDVS